MPDVTITLKTIDQSTAVVKKVNQEFKSLAPGLEKATGNLGKFASANAGLLSVMGGVAVGAVAVGKAIYASAKEWENAAKIGAKLEAILKSTGGAAGQTVGSLNKMADSLAMVNGLDDELVKNGEALLLTFTKIKGEGFEPTMQAAIDMAAVLGGDLNGAVIQVGKAMNDFSGYTALKRAGVSFTAEQVTQIQHFKETNDLVGYQNLLLNELQTEFGGAAKAMTEAGLGGERVALAFGNLKEAIGGANAGWIQDFNRGVAYSTQGLADWVQGMNDAKAATEANKAAYIGLGNEMGRGAAAQQAWLKNFEAFDAQMKRGAATTKYYAERYPELIDGMNQAGQAAQDTEEQQLALEQSSKQYMSVLKNISGETEQFTQKNQDLNDKLAELQTKLAGERKGSKAYKELQGEIEDTKTAVTDLASEHAKASQSMMFDLIAQQAAAEGFKNISVEALAQIGEEWGVLEKGSGAATATMISQAEAWSQALSLPAGQMQSLAVMWANLAKLSKTGIKFTASVVSQATGGAMGGQNTMTACFDGDTPVTMADLSAKHIRDIQIGDIVLSYDLDKHTQIHTTVTEVFEHPKTQGGRLLLINGHLKVTEEHRMWDGLQWTPAGALLIGDKLMNLDGSFTHVRSVRELNKEQPTYNLHVDNEAHNYFAGGVLVHNAKQNDVSTQWRGGKVGNYATGGAGGGWGIVGDRQGGGWVDGVSELVYGNFEVFPSKQAKGMLKSGMLGKVPGFAFGGEDGYTNAGSIPKYNPITPTIAGKSKSSGGATSANSMSIPQAVVQQAAEMQMQTQTVAAQAQQQITSMVTQLQQSQAQAQSVFEDMLAVLKNENPRAIGKQVAYELAKAS